MKNKGSAFGLGAALLLGLAAAVVVLDKTGLLILPDQVGGIVVGLGAAFGMLCLTNALSVRYYRRNEKARREAEIEEKDERTQTIRGLASYRTLRCSNVVYLLTWVALIMLDVPLPALLVVCLGYLANFGVYLYHLVKLQAKL